MSLRGIPSVPLVGQPVGPQRGDVARCPGCGCLYPLADCGGGLLMPVQPVMVPVLRPLRNLLDAQGRPAPVADLQALLCSTACRWDVILLPHPACCAALARAEGHPPVWAMALGGPPPDCARCGASWVDHAQGRVAEVACAAWVAPPTAEPAPESDGV